MLNQVILVGRLVRNPELQITEAGKKVSIVTLAVTRNFKNINSEYDTDFFECTLWTVVAENTAEYCKTGDIIGVKGRLQTRIIEKEDGSKYKKVEIIAERVTFLSSSKQEKIEDDANKLNDDICDVNNDSIVHEELENNNRKNKKTTSKDKKN